MKWNDRKRVYSTIEKTFPGQLAPEERLINNILNGVEHGITFTVLNEDIAMAYSFGDKGRIVGEYLWKQEGLPYYNVWPNLIDGLAKVTLDLPCESVIPAVKRLPRALSVRTPVGHEIRFGDYRIKEFLVYIGAVNRTMFGINISANAGDVDETLEKLPDQYNQLKESLVANWNVCFPLSLKDMTIDQAIDYASSNSEVLHDKKLSTDEEESVKVCIRVLIGIALMASDPDIVEPIVLSKDDGKCKETGDVRFVERAKRRGLFGFNVGARIETSPHYRRPHFGIRWTGAGKSVPKLVPIKGCVVKRKELVQVPTGYLKDQ